MVAFCGGLLSCGAALRRRSIDRVVIYVYPGERGRKGVTLGLDRPGLRDSVTGGGLEEMVLSDPQRFLELCNLRWVDPNEIPEPPKGSPG